MKPPAFTYHQPATVEEALRLQADLEECKVLAGGQSLIPALNMRLAAPTHLVDINGLADLDTVTIDETQVRVGALARHRRVERETAATFPLLSDALHNVAHPVIRNRGTTVGSLVHADPASEMTAVLALLRGHMELASVSGTRTVAAEDFFVGPMESDARPDELALAAVFPRPRGRHGTAFEEIARRHGDYATCGAACLVTLSGPEAIAEARVVYLSMGPVPVVVDLGLGGTAPDAVDVAAVAERAVADLEPEGDIHVTAEYRGHLAQVLTARVLRRAIHNATEPTPGA
ncbi:FAD binding domain-containing protein [Spiractinospora alimapuensis]|uniref:FAD binding domain-containing protein n=1 Tax=Spiractinospora alimapuensis TaxID=2820884 RepID=UPI001F3D4CAE|nr:FAD binding domain-containing protein [Spiractinospora alimapuensis]QVQ53688.1 FAD binding domain-containing protein [Spiractinospora alimapuensis]